VDRATDSARFATGLGLVSCHALDQRTNKLVPRHCWRTGRVLRSSLWPAKRTSIRCGAHTREVYLAMTAVQCIWLPPSEFIVAVFSSRNLPAMVRMENGTAVFFHIISCQGCALDVWHRARQSLIRSITVDQGSAGVLSLARQLDPGLMTLFPASV